MHQNNHFTSGLAQIIKWEQALEEDKKIDEEIADYLSPLDCGIEESIDSPIPQSRGVDVSYFFHC